MSLWLGAVHKMAPYCSLVPSPILLVCLEAFMSKESDDVFASQTSCSGTCPCGVFVGAGDGEALAAFATLGSWRGFWWVPQFTASGRVFFFVFVHPLHVLAAVRRKRVSAETDDK